MHAPTSAAFSTTHTLSSLPASWHLCSRHACTSWLHDNCQACKVHQHLHEQSKHGACAPA